MIAVAIAAGVGAAVAASSDDPAAPTSPKGEPVSYAPATRSQLVPAVPGDAEARIVSALEKSAGVTGISAAPSAEGNMISVDLAGSGDQFRDSWLADLAAGAFVELTHSSQAAYSDSVSAASAVDSNRKDGSEPIPLGVGAARLGQQFGSPTDDVLMQRVRDVAARFGLGVARVAVLHPLESALDVTLVVPENAKIDGNMYELTKALEGVPTDVEGSFIELDSPNGDPLLRTSASFRTGDGGLWFAPGQDDRFGAVHGHGPWG